MPVPRPKGGGVALVQQEEPAVDGQLVDEPVEESDPHPAACRVLEASHRTLHQVVHR
jgi:hypothetical protein